MPATRLSSVPYIDLLLTYHHTGLRHRPHACMLFCTLCAGAWARIIGGAGGSSPSKELVLSRRIPKASSGYRAGVLSKRKQEVAAAQKEAKRRKIDMIRKYRTGAKHPYVAQQVAVLLLQIRYCKYRFRV